MNFLISQLPINRDKNHYKMNPEILSIYKNNIYLLPSIKSIQDTSLTTTKLKQQFKHLCILHI